MKLSGSCLKFVSNFIKNRNLYKLLFYPKIKNVIKWFNFISLLLFFIIKNYFLFFLNFFISEKFVYHYQSQINKHSPLDKINIKKSLNI